MQEPVTEEGLKAQALQSVFVEYGSHFVAGWLGGVAGVVVGHPFDTIKVLQQTRGNEYMYSTALRCSKSIYAEEKFIGFFKGMAFPVAAVGLLNSIFFGVYGNTLKAITEARHNGDRSAHPHYRDVFIAGSIAGAVQGIPACPIELVKVKLQSQISKPMQSQKYAGPMDCVRSIYRTRGVRGCCHGMTATILREMPGFGVYMTSYQYMVDLTTPEGKYAPSVPMTLLVGGLAGVFSWMVNIPVDNIKSKLQSDDVNNPKYRNMWHCFTESVRTNGIRGFWKGAGAVCLRAFPTNAVTFAVYSTSLNYFQGLD